MSENRKENVKAVVDIVEMSAKTTREKFIMSAGIAAAIEFGCWCIRALINTQR